MIGDNIQLALQDSFVAEPFADMAHVALEVKVGVAQLYPCIVDGHLAVGIIEVDRRYIHRLRQPFGQVEFAVFEFDYQPRVPLQQDVLLAGFVSCCGFQIQFAGLGGQFLSHVCIESVR